MNKRTMIIKRVNEEAEDFYEESKRLGTLAAQAFLSISQGTDDKHRSQMTGLENVAETTLKATDVLDYIKKQMGRESKRDKNGWVTVHRFGENLKTFIEGELKNARDRVSVDVGLGDSIEDKRERQHIYLLLIRQLIRQVVVQYEYFVG